MQYTTHATDIVAYAYTADLYCLDCIHGIASPHGAAHGLSTGGVGVEELLDRWARRVGIDRYDESSYDSNDFPKVVFANQIEGEEHCGVCGEEL